MHSLSASTSTFLKDVSFAGIDVCLHVQTMHICAHGNEDQEEVAPLLLLYRCIFAADIKAACQAFSLQRTNGAPCVACKCRVPTNGKPDGCVASVAFGRLAQWPDSIAPGNNGKGMPGRNPLCE
jgi:hypothetical protein